MADNTAIPADAPIVATIVVPSFNRPARLQECLRTLMQMRGPAFEVIVVDDGSPVPLAPICAAFGPRVRCLRQDNQGPAAARNAGAAAAQGAFIAFTDDDCRPDSGWLIALMAAHAGMPRRMVGGHVVNLLGDNPYAAASQSLCDYLYAHWDAAGGDMPFFTSNNIGCLKSDFVQMGGFDQTFPLAAAEDREFGMRWRERGGMLVYAPEAVVGHAHALTFRSFLRQHANYGRGARHLHKVLDARADKRPRLEALRFYSGLVTWPLRRAKRFRVMQSALLGLSQVAMVRGYFGAAGGGNGRKRPSAYPPTAAR